MICRDQGHLVPKDTHDDVTNCERCGVRLYKDDQGGPYYTVPEVAKPVVVDNTVGYFNWRRSGPGTGVTCEKVLKEHVDDWQARNKHRYNQHYCVGVLRTEKLTAELWEKSLTQLAVMFPCPTVLSAKEEAAHAAERSNQDQPPA